MKPLIYTLAILCSLSSLSAANLDQHIRKADAAAKNGNWETAYLDYKVVAKTLSQPRFKNRMNKQRGYSFFRMGQAAEVLAKKAQRAGEQKKAETLFNEAIRYYEKCNKVK